MENKTIMLCNGPLSGQQVAVDEGMKEYIFFQRHDGSVLTQEVPAGAIIAKRRTYRKSVYKFGNFEIFIWEEDVPVEQI